MPRLKEITNKNYRSVCSIPIILKFPKNISDPKIEKKGF